MLEQENLLDYKQCSDRGNLSETEFSGRTYSRNNNISISSDAKIAGDEHLFASRVGRA